MKMRFAVSVLIVVAGVCLSSLEAYAQAIDIKVVQWNVKDNSCSGCGGTAGEPDERDAIVAQNADVVFLQEVDRVDHLDNIVAALGSGWSHRFVNRDNTTDRVGTSFLAILSRFPFSGAAQTKLLNSSNAFFAECGITVPDARAAIGATILINGQPVAVFSTRNTFISGDCVAKEQNRRFKAWANATFPNVTHLYGGDFNMIPGGQAYTVMTVDPPTSKDVWKEALDKGTATAAGDTTPVFNQPTKNNRLDYLFFMNAGTLLSVNSAHITALQTSTASSDGLASDHRMMTAIFTVGDTPPPPLPTDDFNDNSLHPQWSKGVWSGSTQDTTIPVNEVNQRLEIGPLKESATGAHYNALRSSGSHNFSGAYAYVQLVKPADTATGAFSMFAVGKDASNYYRWYVSAGRLVAEKEIAGTKTTVVDIGYNPTEHQFLRICHDSSTGGTGTVVFQTAPNNAGVPGAWFQHRAEAWNATAIPLSAVLFEMKAGTGAPEIAPGTAWYDNFRAAQVANCQ
jgi:endonuclease/exonuclease/phosphatase family metal-dependent hydrolase